MNVKKKQLSGANPYQTSECIQAWHVLRPELNLLQSFDKIRIDQTESELNKIKGDIIEMIGTILVMLLEKPRLIRRELASLHLYARTWVPVNRVDLVTFKKRTISTVWEFKKYSSKEIIDSEQIQTHSNSFGDKLRIGVYNSSIEDPRIKVFETIISDLQLESDLDFFINQTLCFLSN